MISPKIRYFLIGTGIVAFAVAAPIFVLFVKGVKYDFGQKRFLPTGILTVKADPEDAQIFLDGKLVRQTPGTIRFLSPKTYDLSLEKAGYFPWKKKFTVWPNEVVWASPPGEKVFLLANDPAPQTLQTEIADFLLFPGGYAVLTSEELKIYKNGKLEISQKLPRELNVFSSSADFRYFILNNKNNTGSPIFVYDSLLKKFYDLSPLFPSQTDEPKLEFDSQNLLFALSGNNLFRVSLSPLHKDLLLGQVKDFTIFEKDIYNLTLKTQVLSLNSFDQNSGFNQKLFDTLPAFDSATLLVTPQKSLYLIGDGALYALSLDGLQKSFDNVKETSSNFDATGLSLISSAELWVINGKNGASAFITRSQMPFSQPQASQELGYAFTVADNKILAWEINREGEQNTYTLYTGLQIEKYIIQPDFRQAYVLDNGELKTFKLR